MMHTRGAIAELEPQGFTNRPFMAWLQSKGTYIFNQSGTPMRSTSIESFNGQAPRRMLERAPAPRPCRRKGYEERHRAEVIARVL
jgi:hypothetical protein